ncbi:hypothetical protein D3C71_1733430 [compost metagenome]
MGDFLGMGGSVSGQRERVNSPGRQPPLQMRALRLQPPLQRCGNDAVTGRQHVVAIAEQGQVRAQPRRRVGGLQAVFELV